MVAEQGTDLQVQQNAIRSHFIDVLSYFFSFFCFSIGPRVYDWLDIYVSLWQRAVSLLLPKMREGSKKISRQVPAGIFYVQ